MSTSQAQIDMQLEVLVQHHLLLGKSIQQICREQGWTPAVIYRRVQSEEFQKRKAKLQERFGQVSEGFVDATMVELKKMAPLVVTRWREILETSLDEKVLSRIGDSILDRIGIAKQTKVEQKTLVELGPETLKALLEIERQLDAIDSQVIDLPKSDWSYASQRPQDTRTRLLTQRSTQGAVAPESDGVHVLHGQGGDRVQGPRSGFARNDGAVDPERKQTQTGFSPA